MNVPWVSIGCAAHLWTSYSYFGGGRGSAETSSPPPSDRALRLTGRNDMDRPPDDEIEPVVALHQRNVARLGDRDVVIAAYPGSGASLISNILIELGFVH